MGEKTGRAVWVRTVGPAVLLVLALAVLGFAALGPTQERGLQTSWVPTVMIPTVWSAMRLSDPAAFAQRRVPPRFLFLVVWALIAGWTALAVGDGSPIAVAICGAAAVLITYPLGRLLERAQVRQRAEHDAQA